MKDYDPATYGDRIADIYDDLYEAMFDSVAAADLLAELSGGGRAVELGIGTGRVAIPLAARGVDVTGIDASEAMIEELRTKRGSENIDVVLGDFRDVEAAGTFDLIYVLFNTFFALQTQDDQIACFGNVAARLKAGGRFVIEAFVPDPTRWDRHQRLSVDDVAADRVVLEASRHDPVRQVSESQHVIVSAEGIRMFPVSIRYAWPSELDLMARLAGMSLEHRWGGWGREAFTSGSSSHVSVYVKD